MLCISHFGGGVSCCGGGERGLSGCRGLLCCERCRRKVACAPLRARAAADVCCIPLSEWSDEVGCTGLHLLWAASTSVRQACAGHARHACGACARAPALSACCLYLRACQAPALVRLVVLMAAAALAGNGRKLSHAFNRHTSDVEGRQTHKTSCPHAWEFHSRIRWPRSAQREANRLQPHL
jgi:hypothetical protein